MYFIYILYSLKDRNLYVGQTNNLIARVKKHNNGQVISTQRRRPWILIYSESFSTRAEVMRREQYFKSLYGARLKQKILKQYLQSHSLPG